MPFRKIFSSLAVATMACTAMPAMAVSPLPPPLMMHAPPLPALIQNEAHLTPAQNNRIRKIMEANRDKVMARHNDDRAVDDRISAALLVKGDVDKKAVDELVKQKIALHEQAEQQRVAELIAIHDVLTPDQREAVKNAYDEAGKLSARLRDMMAPPPPPPPPPAL